MKKIYLLFPFLFLSFAFVADLNAAILTVSNDVNNPAQYTSPQAAHDAAMDGDTLYLYGSQTVYQNLGVSKTITVIGNGYAPTSMNNNNGFSTRISTITLNENTGAGTSSSNSTFIGLDILSQLDANNFVVIDNITIDRCKINSLDGSFVSNDNWLITNSYMFSCNFFDLQNSIFSNCIFSWNNSFSEVTNTVLISQSLVLSANANKYEGIVFQNNILYGVDFSNSSNFSHCTFTNNMTFDDGTASPLPIGINNNTGANNIEDSDPMFVIFDEVAGCGSSCIDNEDYHLQGGSPAIGAGLGGKDLGIYDGNYPWPDASGYTGMPPIPEVTSFNVINSVVVPGEKVHFDAEAETRN